MVFNKKGQLTGNEMVMLALAVLVLLVVAGGFLTGWKFNLSSIKGLSGTTSIDSVTQSCVQASSSSNTISYCSDWKKITVDTKTVYVNCKYPEIESKLTPMDCSPGLEVAKCGDLLAKKYPNYPRPVSQADKDKCVKYFEDTMVNTVSCTTACA